MDVRTPFDVTKLDYSTLDLSKIRAACPRYVLPPTYRLSATPGNGCFGDPPGYPSYFTYAVHTQHGNSPAKGPEYVFVIPTRESQLEGNRREFELRAIPITAGFSLRRFYKPLPIDHPRVKAWIAETYQHMGRCFEHPTRQQYGRPDMFCVTGEGRLSTFDKDWPLRPRRLEADNDERWAAKLEEYDRARVDFEAELLRHATPETALAGRAVRKFYPEHETDLHDVLNPPAINFNEYPGGWYGWYAEQPQVIRSQQQYQNHGVGTSIDGLKLYALAYGAEAVKGCTRAPVEV